MSGAPELLARAAREGVEVQISGGGLRVRGAPSPELIEALRRHKPDLVALLRGDTCRLCGVPIPPEDWRYPGGARALPFADGTAVHVACDTADLRRRAALTVAVDAIENGGPR